MAIESLLSLRNVAKIYGQRLLFRDLSLELRPGAIYLVLGANGAGKSTLLRLIAGLVKPDAGEIRRHRPLREAYLGHATFIYSGLTAIQNLRFWARAYNLAASKARLMEALALTGLESVADEKAGVFSRGMLQRLNFSRCLMSEPEFFLLDEPFSGMDEPSRENLRSELVRRRENGICAILVSHDPESDSQIADYILTITNRRVGISEC